MYEAGKAYGFFSLQIFIQDLRRSQKRLIRYSVVLTIILCFFYLLYPILSSGHLYDLILFNFLPEMMEDFFKLEWLEQFRSFSFYFPFVVQFIMMLLCIFACMQGLTALRKEEEDGTAEFLFSLPVTRQAVYLSKFYSRLVTIIILNLWCVVATAVLCAIVAPDGSAWSVWMLKVYGFVFISEFVFFSFGFLLSTLIHDITTATSIAFGAFLLTYLCGLAATLFKRIEWLRFVSPYHLVNPFEIVGNSYILDGIHFLFLFLFSILCLLSGCVRYLKKDFLRR